MSRRLFIALGLLCIGVVSARTGETRGAGDAPVRREDPKKESPDSAGSVKREVEKKVPGDAIEALENAETFTFYSLDPKPAPDDRREKVRAWPVVGKVDVTDPAVRKRLVSELWKGVAESDGTFANCFNPRHAIRVTYKDMTIDYVICFECLQVEMTEGRRRGRFLTTKTPQAVFDKILVESKVALPSKGDH